ncbi:PREDICTED: uncharacterized protein LOC109124838 [Camelina sativa]|uniref:Uncharacterized protein LOC109124838 n=1 Tax=Camelina sativa TaxID=90675 RepID=A0ABM1RDZ9_CAMSA|nr:PREDICTED: uncharacterized protein LOC109124838 [Camelina sativa]
MFIASRTRSDGNFICNEARISADKLTQVMNQNIKSEASSSESGPKDAFEQVFGSEHSGRVRCVGRGPTPSKYFQNLESQVRSNSEILELKSRMKGLEDKLDIVANALQIIISNNQFQTSTTETKID